jgi:3-phenylpropionate/trans-cinnamate dioxygenase ferredoxin reductase subunit
MSERIVIVGSSIGGIRTGQALRAGGFDGDIAVIGAEDVDPYDKPPLSKEFLIGEKTASQIRLLDDAGWVGAGLSPLLGQPATGLDTNTREVTLRSGERIGYDRLVIATGARPRRLADTAGNPIGHTVRDLDDSQALQSAMRRGGHVVVIGGGFIGCEVAATASEFGCTVTIVDTAPAPLARVLGTEIARVIAAAHAEAGTTVHSDAVVDSVHRHGADGARVTLTDGHVLDADVLVAGIGVTPNSEWLADSAAALDNGVRTDEYCRVRGTTDVYALGDVANWYDVSVGRPRRVGHWTNAVDQANIVAHNIIKPEEPWEYHAAPYFWSDQYGRKIQMVGHGAPTDTVEVREFEVSGRRLWAAVFSRHGLLSAAVTLGWPRGMAVLRRIWLQRGGAEEALAELDAAAAKATRPSVAATG